MKNADQPASPCMMQQIGNEMWRAHKEGDPKEYRVPCAGLTKRERIAAMAMAGLLANPELYRIVSEQKPAVILDIYTKAAIDHADDLLNQLEQ